MRARVTIVDVAQRAGVSISSASAALNDNPGVSDSTRARVRDAADQLGYVPSLRGRSLSSRRAFAVGLVVQRQTDVLESDPFFGALIGGIESVLADRGYALVLHMVERADAARDRYEQLAAGRRVDGVFLDELQNDDPRIAQMQRLELPAVAINPGPDFPLPAVRQHADEAIHDLIARFVAEGHRAIAHVSGAAGFVHTEQRISAWRSACAELGIDEGVLLAGDFTYDGGRAAAEQLLASGELPTAIFCANDLTAVGLMIRLQEAGLSIPGDVAIAGFDGIALGRYVRPQLTTILSAPREVGSAAATMLLDIVDRRAVEDIDVAPATLETRESTGSRTVRPRTGV